MSIHVSQTSAALFVRATHLDETDVKRLIGEFGIHPLDVEKLEAIPRESAIDVYRSYCHLQLVIPWRTTGGVVGIDLQLIYHPKFLLVVGETPAGTIHHLADSMADQSHITAEELLTRSCEALLKDCAQQVALTAQARGAADRVRLIIQGLETHLEKLDVHLTTDQHERIALGLHRVKNAQTAHVSEPTSTTVIPANARLTFGYVMASAAVFFLVLMLRT